MAIRNLNWYNLQATRRYPLDDTCIGETDSGENLPNDIIVDCHIRFADNLGEYAYVQAVTISPGLATVVIGVSESLAAAGKSIAAVTIPQPAAPNVNYPITSLTDGVAGWIVFGAGVTTNFSGRFSFPSQTLLAPRCARAYKPLPIPSIKKIGLAEGLTGIVDLIAESPLTFQYDTAESNGATQHLVVFKLNKADASVAYNPFSYFLGSCGQRPESGTCPKTPISTINGIAPDCAGNIEILFSNLTAQKFENCGGIDLLTPYGLKDACQGPPPLPLFYSDLCCPQKFASTEEWETAPASLFSAGEIVRVNVAEENQPAVYEYYKVVSLSEGAVTWDGPLPANDADLKAALATCEWPDPTELIPDIVIQLESVQDYPAVTLPVCIDFCSCDPSPPLFDEISGTFSAERTLAPFGCVPCGLNIAPPATQADLQKLTERNTYLSVDSGGVAASMFKNHASDWAFGRVITAQLKINARGVDRNGGIIINYRKVNVNGIERIKYFVAAVDVSRGQLRLLEYTNTNYVVLTTVPMAVKTNQWYKMSVSPAIRGAYVYLNITATEIGAAGLTAKIIDYGVPLRDYEPQTGAFGLYAERSYTNFNAFTIT
jgi:hypothetical protein